MPWNRSPGLVFVELCSISQAGAVGQAPGPNFGRKHTKNQEKLKYLILPIGPNKRQQSTSTPHRRRRGLGLGGGGRRRHGRPRRRHDPRR